MTTSTAAVIGGVDTHKHTHYAAVIDDQRPPARPSASSRPPIAAMPALLAWMRSHGQVEAIGVESTGSFGATLTRWLTKAGVRVIEVNRPNRSARRMDGKSDRLDAEQIARSVLGLTATAIPKSKSGMVEVIRTLAGHPGQRGEVPHPGVQHPVRDHDRRALAAARRARRR